MTPAATHAAASPRLQSEKGGKPKSVAVHDAQIMGLDEAADDGEHERGMRDLRNGRQNARRVGLFEEAILCFPLRDVVTYSLSSPEGCMDRVGWSFPLSFSACSCGRQAEAS